MALRKPAAGHGRAAVLVGLLLALLVAFPAGAQAAGRHAPAIPPNASPFGKSYGEWSALWWQQAFAVDTTSSSNPFADGAQPCSLGTRKVRFLVGGTVNAQTAERSCTIHTGQAIFFPVINAECSELEGNGSTEAQLRSCAAGFGDAFTSLHATVDGVPVRNLSRFRVQSPLFRFTAVENNPFGVPPGGPTPSVSDGYWVMLHPLPPGEHTISFGGALPAFDFTTAATYTIRVVGGRR
jgi:hypothetical protein